MAKLHQRLLYRDYCVDGGLYGRCKRRTVVVHDNAHHLSQAASNAAFTSMSGLSMLELTRTTLQLQPQSDQTCIALWTIVETLVKTIAHRDGLTWLNSITVQGFTVRYNSLQFGMGTTCYSPLDVGWQSLNNCLLLFVRIDLDAHSQSTIPVQSACLYSQSHQRPRYHIVGPLC